MWFDTILRVIPRSKQPARALDDNGELNSCGSPLPQKPRRSAAAAPAAARGRGGGLTAGALCIGCHAPHQLRCIRPGTLGAAGRVSRLVGY